MADRSQRLQPAPRDHFLKLMFFEPSRLERDEPAHPTGEGRANTYAPLHSFVARPGVRYALPRAGSPMRVDRDSPASVVMTDLRSVSPVTIAPDASIDAANQLMIERRVRALFVVDEATRHVLGVITATDILGERPLQVAQRLAVHRSDLAVRDIMTAADRLEVLDLHDVARARVGDIVASLQRDGRQHALAVETTGGNEGGTVMVCGIFSLTQIARQLGVAPGPAHDIARTFVEIESAIAG